MSQRPVVAAALLSLVAAASGAGATGSVQLTVAGPEAWSPTVTRLPGATVLVTWRSGSFGNRLEAKQISFDGLTVGQAFELWPEDNDVARFEVNVARVPGGEELLVTWIESTLQGMSYWGRRFAFDGSPIDAAFRLDDGSSSWQLADSGLRADVASDGSSVVLSTGQALDSSEPDQSSSGVKWRRFSSLDTPLTPPTAANSCTFGEQRSAGLASHPDGSFAAVWRSSCSFDDDPHSIQIRFFDADGVPLGPEQQVNLLEPGVQYPQSGAALFRHPDGRLLAVWTDSSTTIAGRLYSSSGSALGQPSR